MQLKRLTWQSKHLKNRHGLRLLSTWARSMLTERTKKGMQMTNEQIIEVLSEIRSGYNCFDESERRFYEALSEAIKALSCSEKPNRSDTIYRQDAIDVVKGIDSYFVKYIEQLPSAQRKGKWIDDTCIECGYSVQPWNNTPFCPRCGSYNCGADMRGKKYEID